MTMISETEVLMVTLTVCQKNIIMKEDNFEYTVNSRTTVLMSCPPLSLWSLILSNASVLLFGESSVKKLRDTKGN